MSNQLQVSGEAKIRAIQGPVVANSGVITALDGDASEYVRGDGTLADFPTSTGGGSSVSYYLNTSVSQGTIGGVAYKQLSKTPISGAGTDVTTSANGYIASYITDANDPALLEVPAGNFNCEFYFSVNSNAHNPYVYAEVYKYDGTTFTLLGSNVSIPQYLNNGTTLSPYYFAIAVSTAVLTVTDRIAIRIYVNVDTKTVTLHTENNHLCQVVTTFSKGLISLNNLTRQNQFFATGTSGTDFNISSTTATHTFNIPSASATNRGLITTGSQTIAGDKTFSGSIILNGGVDMNNSLNVNSGFFIRNNVIGSTLYTSFSINKASNIETVQFLYSTGFASNLLFNDAATYSYSFPTASGTIALTSNLSSYVPYTGATTNVNLGGFGITASAINVGNIVSDGNIILKKVGLSVSTPLYVTQFAATTGVGIGYSDGTGGGNFAFPTAAIYTYTFPSASGTLALTSDLGAYVPYTGATGAVNLGFNLLTTNSINLDGNSVSGVLNIKSNSSITTSGAGYVSLVSGNVNQLSFVFNGGNSATFTSVSLSASRTYSLPDAGGTIALLSGTQTFTGATTFSSDLLVSGLTIGRGGSAVVGNTAIGAGTLAANTTGVFNTALGSSALASNTIGVSNTAIGANSLLVNTTGNNNTAIGTDSLNVNTTGSKNTAIGYYALVSNTTASNNIAIGYYALSTNSTAAYNLAIGNNSLRNNVGTQNIGIGEEALLSNTIGQSNTAIGFQALQGNTTGGQNFALGIGALANNTTGSGNIAIGASTLASNITTSNSIGIGFNSLLFATGGNNIAIGNESGKSITTGSNNTIIGAYAGTAGMSNNIVLADGAGTIRYQWNGTNNAFTGAATFSSSVGVGGATNTLGFLEVWKSGSAIAQFSIGQNATYHTDFFVDTTGNFYIQPQGNTRMTILSGGNVGIGTSDPQAPLHIIKALGSNVFAIGESGTNTRFAIGQEASYTGNYINSTNIDLKIQSYLSGGSGGTIIFQTGASGSGSLTERMRITSGGQLSTTFNSVDNNAVFANINSNPYGPWIKFTTDPNNTTNYYLVCSALVSGTEYNKLKITSNGNVYNVTGTYTSGVSDIRYKEQVVDANSQWNDIKSLRVVNFKFIKDVEQNGDNALRQIGFIAQEVEKVSPNLIDEMSDEKTGETWKTIKASIIHTKAIKALQEAMTRIETLEATITSLQDRLDKLENK